MASVTTTLTDICGGGNHLQFSVTGRNPIRLMADDLTQPITEDDLEVFVRVVVRLARQGRTNAQARSLLQAGVTVTV